MAKKNNGKSSKKFIKQEVQAKVVELTNTTALSNMMLRRHLGLESDDKDPKTFTGNEDYIKELARKLAKAKAKRNS